jgi:NADH:ubiquinone oxidoreductase subunit 3 (subunit A)
MLFPAVLSMFLYFPEDKSEYIPAFIKLAIFILLTVLAMRLVIKISKREEKKAKELEKQLKYNAKEKDSL